MNLDEAQRKKVTEWIAQGQKLSEIQNQLMSEFGLRMTYMEVRFLVDDLKLTPKDAEPAKPAQPLPGAAAGDALGGAAGAAVGVPPAGGRPGATPAAAPPAEPAAMPGEVSVTVDQLARPGAVVSGKVTFSDGQRAEWYLDQTGRLGLAPQQPGYRPPAGDVQQFQAALEAELSKMGF